MAGLRAGYRFRGTNTILRRRIAGELLEIFGALDRFVAGLHLFDRGCRQRLGLTHLLVGFSGVDPYPFQMGFHNSEAACTKYSAGLWSMTECIEAFHLRGMGDVEAISSAQLDANGDINISWLAMPVRDAEGKPTGEMNPRALRLPGGAGAPVVYGLHKKGIGYFAGHSKMVLVPKVNYITGTRFYFTKEE